MIEGQQLGLDDILNLFYKSMKNQNDPTLREYFIVYLMKSDDNLMNFNLIDMINKFIKNKQTTGRDLTRKEDLMFKISNSNKEMTDVDFEPYFD